MNVGTRADQRRKPAGGDLAGTGHENAAPPQVEARQVDGGAGHRSSVDPSSAPVTGQVTMPPLGRSNHSMSRAPRPCSSAMPI